MVTACAAGTSDRPSWQQLNNLLAAAARLGARRAVLDHDCTLHTNTNSRNIRTRYVHDSDTSALAAHAHVNLLARPVHDHTF